MPKVHSSPVSSLPPAVLRAGILLVLLFSFLPACKDTTELPVETSVQIGDVTGVRQKHFQYVKGNLVDCRNVTVDVLVGDIRGKSKNIYVNSMKGNIEGEKVTVNVLEGNILGGGGIAINVQLSGMDMTGRARVNKRIEPKER